MKERFFTIWSRKSQSPIRCGILSFSLLPGGERTSRLIASTGSFDSLPPPFPETRLARELADYVPCTRCTGVHPHLDASSCSVCTCGNGCPYVAELENSGWNLFVPASGNAGWIVIYSLGIIFVSNISSSLSSCINWLWRVVFEYCNT